MRNTTSKRYLLFCAVTHSRRVTGTVTHSLNFKHVAGSLHHKDVVTIPALCVIHGIAFHGNTVPCKYVKNMTSKAKS